MPVLALDQDIGDHIFHSLALRVHDGTGIEGADLLDAGAAARGRNAQGTGDIAQVSAQQVLQVVGDDPDQDLIGLRLSLQLFEQAPGDILCKDAGGFELTQVRQAFFHHTDRAAVAGGDLLRSVGEKALVVEAVDQIVDQRPLLR